MNEQADSMQGLCSFQEFEASSIISGGWYTILREISSLEGVPFPPVLAHLSFRPNNPIDGSRSHISEFGEVHLREIVESYR